MSIKTYDEAIGDMRREYDLDLSKVFNEDDLEAAFDKLNAPDRPDAKETLKKFTRKFFEGSTDEVQNQVTENFSNKINKVTSADTLIKVPDIVSNVRENKVLQDAVDLKASTFIAESTTGDQLSRRSKAREVVSDVGEFDKLVEQQKLDLTLDEINNNIQNFPFIFQEQSASKLRTLTAPSGFQLSID